VADVDSRSSDADDPVRCTACEVTAVYLRTVVHDGSDWVSLEFQCQRCQHVWLLRRRRQSAWGQDALFSDR
jgi:hypothetical protein